MRAIKIWSYSSDNHLFYSTTVNHDLHLAKSSPYRIPVNQGKVMLYLQGKQSLDFSELILAHLRPQIKGLITDFSSTQMDSFQQSVAVYTVGGLGITFNFSLLYLIATDKAVRFAFHGQVDKVSMTMTEASCTYPQPFK